MDFLPDLNQYKIHLAKILHCFEKHVKLEETDIVLIFMQLNAEEKILEFMEWVHTKMVGEKLMTTASEIIGVAVRIHDGRTDLP